jgi:uncharacterized protein
MESASRLTAILAAMPRVAVAFSGGVDSAVVSMAAKLAKGDEAIAITADSPSVPRSELAAAIQLAQHIGIAHRVVRTEEFANPEYLKNDGRRCYFCKSTLYETIHRLLPELGDPVVCSGANLDDNGDYRPGLTAAAEKGIRHPLQEAGLTKADVRALARHWQLPVWDKPASPCLSSRIAPGLAVTVERTGRVERAEAYLKSLGLSDVTRLAGEQTRASLDRAFREIGFRFVTLDLAGLRSGSLNELIDVTVKSQYSPTPVTI